MSLRSTSAALGLALAAAAAPLGAQTTIGNSLSFGEYSCSNTGPGASACGQAFTTPAGPDAALHTFEFLFRSEHQLDFALRAWNGTTATGPVLFSQTVAPVPAASWITFDLGGIVLPAGTQLVAYLALDAGEQVSFGWSFQDPYAGGVAAGTADVLVDAFWGPSTDPADDLAFRATFRPAAVAAVPEPSTYALMATGLVALVGVRRRHAAAR